MKALYLLCVFFFCIQSRGLLLRLREWLIVFLMPQDRLFLNAYKSILLGRSLLSLCVRVYVWIICPSYIFKTKPKIFLLIIVHILLLPLFLL